MTYPESEYLSLTTLARKFDSNRAETRNAALLHERMFKPIEIRREKK